MEIATRLSLSSNPPRVSFILPGSIISSALSSSGIAGQAIVRDISTGYFDKLLLTPVRRTALLLSATFVGALILGFQSALIAFVGVLLGLNPPSDIVGIAAVVAIAVLVGNALAGFTVGIALRSGNPAVTQGASFLFFPLTLLTAAFTPIELLGSTLQAVARINPVTYVLNSMRAILLDGWNDPETILFGIGIALALSLMTFTFAFISLRARSQRK